MARSEPTTPRKYRRGAHMYRARSGWWYAYVPGRKQVSLRTRSEEVARERLRMLAAQHGLILERPAKPERKTGSVYFVRAGDTGPIKIGWTEALGARIRTIDANCPAAVRLLAAFFAPEGVEVGLHARFAGHRVHGEWFEPGPVLDYLATLAEMIEASLSIRSQERR